MRYRWLLWLQSRHKVQAWLLWYWIHLLLPRLIPLSPNFIKRCRWSYWTIVNVEGNKSGNQKMESNYIGYKFKLEFSHDNFSCFFDVLCCDRVCRSKLKYIGYGLNGSYEWNKLPVLCLSYGCKIYFMPACEKKPSLLAIYITVSDTITAFYCISSRKACFTSECTRYVKS